MQNILNASFGKMTTFGAVEEVYLRRIKKLYSMSNFKGAVVVNTERCKGCNLCVVACPANVLELHPREVNNKGYHYVYMKQPEACVGCASCGQICPDGCLTVYRAKI